jgi:hypothetical protein
MVNKNPELGKEIIVRLTELNVNHRGTYVGTMPSSDGDRHIVVDHRGPLVAFKIWREIDADEWFEVE